MTVKKEEISGWFKNFFKNRFRVGAAIFLIVVLGFLGWRVVGRRQKSTQYQTAKVERGTLVSSVTASGQIISSNMITVQTQATGIIKNVFVKDGQKVKAGQKIAEITLDQAGQQKNASTWSSYLSAKNSLESAKITSYTLDSSMWAAQQKFMKDAVARGLTVDDPTYIQQHDDWLAAEAKYKSQQAVITQAQSALNNAWLTYQQSSPVISAPISGTILSLPVAEGMTIVGSQTVAVISNQANPLASFNLSEIDVSKVKADPKATITIDNISGKTFAGKVVSVDRVGTVTSGVANYPVIIRFDTTIPEVLPNMAANVNIIIDSKDNVLLIPSSAIQNVSGQSLVRILKNGKEQQVEVETGLSSDTQIEIISGLSEGEEVITSVVSGNTTQQFGTSPFGGFGGGAVFRAGGAGGGQRR